MSVPSNAVLTRARVARRAVALLLVVAGLAACAMSVLNVTGGVLGDVRFTRDRSRSSSSGRAGPRPGSCAARPRRTCGC